MKRIISYESPMGGGITPLRVQVTSDKTKDAFGRQWTGFILPTSLSYYHYDR